MPYSLSLRDSRTILRLAACAAFALSFVFAGCGPPDDQPELGTVTGTITRNGEPLANAWVEFAPEKGRLSAGQTDEEGIYTLKYTFDAPGAKVGTHTVKIGTGGGTPDHSSRRAAAANARQQLFEKSGVKVESGENTIDFEITEGNEYTGPTRGGPRGAHGGRRRR